jgi:hypothetical protein
MKRPVKPKTVAEIEKLVERIGRGLERELPADGWAVMVLDGPAQGTAVTNMTREALARAARELAARVEAGHIRSFAGIPLCPRDGSKPSPK